MDEELVRFRITNLSARVPEGVRIVWQNRECESGPLTLELDDGAPESGNQGVLNYSRRWATAEFHLLLASATSDTSMLDLRVATPITEANRDYLPTVCEILIDVRSV